MNDTELFQQYILFASMRPYVVQSFFCYFNTEIEESAAKRSDFVCMSHTKSSLLVTLCCNL